MFFKTLDDERSGARGQPVATGPISRIDSSHDPVYAHTRRCAFICVSNTKLSMHESLGRH